MKNLTVFGAAHEIEFNAQRKSITECNFILNVIANECSFKMLQF